MNYSDLMAYLDLEDPGELTYFEDMADIIESEEDIEPEALYQLFEGADRKTVSGLIDDYFEEITNALPDDSAEIYTLLEQVRLCLIGLIDNAEDDSDMRRFVDEFCRFRDWYVYDSQVELTPDEHDDYHESDNDDRSYTEEECLSLRDAITVARAEKLGGREYRYNFDQALDYELDSYTMSFAELAAIENDNENL